MNPDEANGDIFRYAQYRGVWIYRSVASFYFVMATVEAEHTMCAASTREAENIINAFLDCK